jgi:hypothetical protein
MKGRDNGNRNKDQGIKTNVDTEIYMRQRKKTERKDERNEENKRKKNEYKNKKRSY